MAPATLRRSTGERGAGDRLIAAIVNKDGSLNVYLDALPVDRKLNIRDPKPRDNQKSQGEELAS